MMDWRRVLKTHLESRNSDYIIFKMSHVFPGPRHAPATKEQVSNRGRLANPIGRELSQHGVIKLDEYTITVYNPTTPRKYLAVKN